MPKASYALRPTLNKKKNRLGEKRDGRFFVVCFLQTSRRHTFDLDTQYTHGQRSSCRARPVNIYRWRPPKFRVDPWSRGREVARNVLRSFLPKPEKCLFFATGDGSRFFVICFPHTSGQMFFFQTPGRRPPYHRPSCVGAPNERAPLRAHDAIAVFAVRRPARTRIADQGLGGFHEHCAGFARAIKFRVSCPGEFKICPRSSYY